MKKRILKILSIILIALALFVAALSIRHHFKSKSDRELFTDAYGEFYTTPGGVKELTTPYMTAVLTRL